MLSVSKVINSKIMEKWAQLRKNAQNVPISCKSRGEWIRCSKYVHTIG
jgi:hypothetical protein